MFPYFPFEAALEAAAVAMVTIVLEDDDDALDPALLSEEALSDWNRPEEDKAWEYLQEVI